VSHVSSDVELTIEAICGLNVNRLHCGFSCTTTCLTVAWVSGHLPHLLIRRALISVNRPVFLIVK
jgi:hypothetical protein